MPNITVIIHTPQELNHSSYIQTGLFELERMGLIKVEVQISTRKNRGMLTVGENGSVTKSLRPFPKASFYTLVDDATGKKITFATDLYDFAEHFSEAALKNCDFYFKRNYENRFVEAFNLKYNKTIVPLGLTFRVQSAIGNTKRNKLHKGVIFSNLALNIKFDRLLFRRLKAYYNYISNHIKKSEENRNIERFEKFEKNIGSNDSILFQTRCFLHENNKDVKEIHQQRYHIIKLLRQNFPDKFLGGFIPSKVADERYGDALTNVPTAPEEYLDAMKKTKIVIYTRGLANSPAWKMAEYLSQGKVIIAERLTAELPVPLTDGKELLYFDSDEELLGKIKLVSEDTLLATSLSVNARAYFEKHVHPVQNVKRILEIMLNKAI
ncbi:glycosyltransferase [Gelidibacter japonicus]|uniref:glycosyltransferase n=1 Tax=Gelidibacter japonicus TaxID=1962232 RepID=UPI003A901262